MYLPITTRQTVSGVARNRPVVPHSHVQNTVATISAKEDTPTLDPYNHGLSRLLLRSSSVAINATVKSGALQLSKNATIAQSGRWPPRAARDTE
jgi:hypothetical protein